jgi:hypothetical protein
MKMEISEFTLDLAEKYRSTKAAWYDALDDDDETASREEWAAVKKAYHDAEQSFASSALDDIDKARRSVSRSKRRSQVMPDVSRADM